MSLPPAASVSYPFDAGPLVEPVHPGAARAFVQELRRAGRLKGSPVFGALVVVLISFVVIVLFGAVTVTLVTSAVAAATAGVDGGGIAVLFGILPLVVIGIIAAVGITLFVRGARSSSERMYRLDRFARANAMRYEPRLDDPGLPGMIFAIGSSRHSSDLVRGDRPRFVEFANYRYTTGSGKNQQTHHWGYVAVKLDTPLPHIVLDATSNNGLFGSNLPLTFDKDQRLSLEGDFDEYFSLYCPADYERDALYLFTPDIMARFIDNAAALDVEIVDDWLFLYAKRDFSTLDPATWAWLFSVIGALLEKFAQWARWRDERLAAVAAGVGTRHAGAASVPFSPPLDALRPPPGVAAEGRRLQRGVPWVPIIVGGVMVLFWIFTQIGPAFLR
ncbi:hypothetical protein [Microbacterium sp. LWH3-1.2]|uniref:hypothetical protein n=1 Tax=Microbacterium sp. LWH3-1.2 TaxID=3135256 RepID=UPI0034465816